MTPDLADAGARKRLYALIIDLSDATFETGVRIGQGSDAYDATTEAALKREIRSALGLDGEDAPRADGEEASNG